MRLFDIITIIVIIALAFTNYKLTKRCKGFEDEIKMLLGKSKKNTFVKE
jgi:hypothetical protein|nr:hypothetical protein [uncultured Lachnoclostridium sp.]